MARISLSGLGESLNRIFKNTSDDVAKAARESAIWKKVNKVEAKSIENNNAINSALRDVPGVNAASGIEEQMAKAERAEINNALRDIPQNDKLPLYSSDVPDVPQPKTLQEKYQEYKKAKAANPYEMRNRTTGVDGPTNKEYETVNKIESRIYNYDNYNKNKPQIDERTQKKIDKHRRKSEIEQKKLEQSVNDKFDASAKSWGFDDANEFIDKIGPDLDSVERVSDLLTADDWYKWRMENEAVSRGYKDTADMQSKILTENESIAEYVNKQSESIAASAGFKDAAAMEAEWSNAKVDRMSNEALGFTGRLKQKILGTNSLGSVISDHLPGAEKRKARKQLFKYNDNGVGIGGAGRSSGVGGGADRVTGGGGASGMSEASEEIAGKSFWDYTGGALEWAAQDAPHAIIAGTMAVAGVSLVGNILDD